MSDYSRFGADRDDRYRQDDYQAGDYREGAGRQRSGSYGGRGYGDDRGERFGQSYGEGRSEGRSFSTHEPYSGSNYGSAYGEEAYRARQFGGGQSSGQFGGDRGGSRQGRYDERSDDRQAAGSMLHQGYRSPFGERGGYDRNEFRPYGSEGQRYQYNNYQPTHDQAGRNANEGSSARYGVGAGYADGQQRDRGLWDQTRDEVSSWFGDDEAARRRRMDSQNADHHGGKGPKGYTRSDDRIRENVNDRLTDDYSLDASDIDVKVDKGEVTLSGHVSNRGDKRRAEDLADAIGGVKHVQNNLRVKDQATSSPYLSSDANQNNGQASGQTTSQPTGSTSTAGATSASTTRSN